ncbi:AraC family transcriptional regulator [Dyadobacter tibetensis]|uniref:AraC family transcriptional regulator n=1 Tax=Dyadobacter tibetensis TaxID=1211851 RepID=UPI00046EC9D6|nr:AraC family transcriptional regulator [Dyadobacter tibetensis]
MKVIPFTIPVVQDQCLVVQERTLNHYYPHLHRHQEVQLEYVVEGSGILIVGNYMQRFQSGDIYLIGANQAHIFKSDPIYFAPESELRTKSVSIFFNLKYLQESLLLLPELQHLARFIVAHQNGCQVPETHANHMSGLVLTLAKARGSLLISSFIELLQSFTEIPHLKPLSTNVGEQLLSEVEGNRMDRIFQYLVSHHQKHISLAEIANEANLSPQAFCRYFKKHTGKTFVAFLNEIRVNEACKLILSGKLETLAEVAFASGFENVTNFNRVFRKVTGKAPGTYRRSFRHLVTSTPD